MRSACRSPILVVCVIAAAALLLGSCRWIRGLTAAPPEGRDAGDGGPGVALVSFALVAPIIGRVCAQSCHDGRGLAADDFVFSNSGDLHERLWGSAPPTVPPPCQNRRLVVPGDPESSLIMAMIEEPEGPRAGCAERMPQSCPDQRPCLSAAEIQTIRQWILEGAAR